LWYCFGAVDLAKLSLPTSWHLLGSSRGRLRCNLRPERECDCPGGVNILDTGDQE
jgi:hypothetical protein